MVLADDVNLFFFLFYGRNLDFSIYQIIILSVNWDSNIINSYLSFIDTCPGGV